MCKIGWEKQNKDLILKSWIFHQLFIHILRAGSFWKLYVLFILCEILYTWEKYDFCLLWMYFSLLIRSIVDTLNDYASQSYSFISSSVLSPFFILLIASVRSIIIWNCAFPKVQCSLKSFPLHQSFFTLACHPPSDSICQSRQLTFKEDSTFKGTYKVT